MNIKDGLAKVTDKDKDVTVIVNFNKGAYDKLWDACAEMGISVAEYTKIIMEITIMTKDK